VNTEPTAIKPETRSDRPAAGTQPPQLIVGNLATGFLHSRCLHAVVELGVPDALGDEPEHVGDLAAKVGAVPDALSRVLRVLASSAVFTDMGADRYAHSPASRLLRTDHPQSMDLIVRLWAARYHWAAYELLPETVRTGRTAFEAAFGCRIFDYFKSHEDEARQFDRAMTARAAPANAAVLRACRLENARRVVDIGGGVGHLIEEVLRRRPQVEGVLFDLPGVVQVARQRNVARLAYCPGDFFVDPIPESDVYLMMQILHDWSDDDCIRILRNVGRSMPEGSRLLVIEMLLNKSADATSMKDLGIKVLDIEMLALFGGRERTAAEFAALLAEAGLRLVGVTPTASPMNILEVVPGAANTG
jgi:hypothetical protein